MIDELLPRPREVRVDGDATIELSELIESIDPESPDLLGLPPGGYQLSVRPSEGRAVLIAVDHEGLARGRARVARLTGAGVRTPAVTIRDWPELAVRGVVEGFYGPPWTHPERTSFLRFAAGVGFNHYVYAPKDDPYHRERWRDPYPPELIAEIAELAHDAAEHSVRFVYAIAPALSMRFSDDDEHHALHRKAEQLWDAGVRHFALLFDDVPMTLQHAEDVALFGTDDRATGAAHGVACRRFEEEFLAPRGYAHPLGVCPTDYAGTARSAYRDGLAETLPHDALVMWTGADIVVGEVTRADIDAAAESYRRRLLLWDNFPVNDFDRSRLFLGPLVGRTTDLEGSALVGILSNPMVEAMPSRFSLATVADWAWNPGDYDPPDAARRAAPAVAGRHVRAVAALVKACSAWPPSAPQSEELQNLADDALSGDRQALDGLEVALDALRTAGDTSGSTTPFDPSLAQALEPWFAAARDMGDVGVGACRLLRDLNTRTEALPAERDAVVAALTRAEAHFPNVLRGMVPPFVREVLTRSGLEGVATPAKSRALLLTGATPVPGERDLIERLTARGMDVRTVSALPLPSDLAEFALALVTRRAPADAAAALAAEAVPVLAWGRLDTLGLSSRSGGFLAQEELVIIEPSHPLAAGQRGTVRIYRGPGNVSWGEPGADAVVVARTKEQSLPAIAFYPAGARLASGAIAPADRVLFFLAEEGLAPWLIAPESAELFFAAVDRLSDRVPSPA